MRRILGGFAAFLAVTGTFLVLPVYAAPLPAAKPVAPSLSAVPLGSVDSPQDAASSIAAWVKKELVKSSDKDFEVISSGRKL